MYALRNKETGVESPSSVKPVWLSGVWECESFRVTDQFQSLFEVIDYAALQDQSMTVLAYRNRFTAAEKIAIEMAALDDPAATMAERQQAAAVRVYVQDLASAKFIDPQDEATRAGALALEALGLLAKGRALEILDAPIQAKERL